MKAGAMVESKFLKKEDLNYDNGNVVTITKLERQNVGMNEAEEEMKWTMHFREFPKAMVLNSTNIQLTEKALGSDETDDWIGKKITIYVDDNVSFGGKLVGGIRIRKAKNVAPASSQSGLAAYPAESFTANFPKWVDLVTSGKKTPADIIAMLSTKATISADQRAQIAAIGDEVDGSIPF